MDKTLFLIISGCFLFSPLFYSQYYNVNDRSEFTITRNNTSDKLEEIHAGDFNNDGHVDLLIDGGLELNQSGHMEFNSKPLFYLGDSNNNLTLAPTTFTHPGNSAFICDVADYDNDNILDLLVADFWANGMRLYKGSAGLNFTLAQNLPTGTHGAKGRFKDMDGDQDLDIVNVSSDSAAVVALHFFENVAGVYTGLSYNTVIVPQIHHQPDMDYNPILLTTDLNHDGRMDVCSISYNNRINTWVQNSDKTFTAWAERPANGMANFTNQ